MNHRKKHMTASPADIIGEVQVAGVTYPLQRGMAMTTAGLRGAVGYAVQKAWFDASGLKEPARVRARRERLGTPGSQTGGERGSPPRPQVTGPSAAELIRKGLVEGSTTEEIVKTVMAFNHPCKARDVAYYRHQLRAQGKLPARIARTA